MALIALDTDVSSLIIKDKLPATMAGRLVGNKLAISFVTLGELTKWVEVRQWGSHRRTRLDAFRRDKFVMLGDEEIAVGWGRPANDSWIAACCLVYGIPLATFNIKDYLYFKDEHGLALVTA